MTTIKIENVKWKSVDTNTNTELEETLSDVLATILLLRNTQTSPRGLEIFKYYRQCSDAIIAAKQSGVIELEESSYNFLVGLVKTDMPASWGVNKNVAQAVDVFLSARTSE